MRNLAAPLLLTMALALVPAASAEYYEGKPDCPPDMFCTESAPLEPSVSSTAGAGGLSVGFAALGALAVLAAVLAVRLR